MPDKHKNTKKPDWQPENAGSEYAVSIVKGIADFDSIPKAKKPSSSVKRQGLSIDDHVEGVLNSDRSILARSITLVESNSMKHIEKGQEVLKRILPHTGKSIRVGITGAPGAGKSTFIESLGSMLCSQSHNVAVLAIDPSSTKSRGSILGDKTRMEKLSRFDNAFIRPSPSGGTLGGVARKTRETILLCEAAGFDIILVETVGVGQSEITVRSMVDFFLLLLLPGGGDELQGIKKGIVELSDAIVVNKAEADNRTMALQTLEHYKMAVHYIQQATEGWNTEVFTTSALHDIGVAEVWKNIEKYKKYTSEKGIFEKRRKDQTISWMMAMIEDELHNKFFASPSVAEALPRAKEKVMNGDMTPTSAVNYLLGRFFAE